jgi:hypothetical protein
MGAELGIVPQISIAEHIMGTQAKRSHNAEPEKVQLGNLAIGTTAK